MTCNACGNEAVYRLSVVYSVKDGQRECCDRCGAQGDGEAMLPDVYLERSGQKFANLCDKMGTPYEITSKRHKKRVMKELGVQEAGGTFNGAPFGTRTWVDGSRAYRKRQFEKDRPMIRENYRRYLAQVKK